MTMFRELFEPMKVGPMHVVNRIMMSAMSPGMVLDDNGEITPEMIAYFSACGTTRVWPPPAPARWFQVPSNGNTRCRSIVITSSSETSTLRDWPVKAEGRSLLNASIGRLKHGTTL
jgi:hypothetical protein